MKEIDWSKAPDGATHYDSNDDSDSGWTKIQGGDKFYYTSNDGGAWVPFTMSADSYGCGKLIPRPTQWKGPQDGLPPVGYTQDDCAMVHMDESEKFTIVAHHHGYAIVAFGPSEDGGMVMSTAARESDFIPSKTERDKAADDFLKITGVHYSWHHTLGLIHDAGYRKMIDRDDASNILHDMVADAVQTKGGDLFECLDTNKALDALGYKE